MFNQNGVKILLFSCTIALLASCGDVNTIFPSATSNYEVGASILSTGKQNNGVLQRSGSEQSKSIIRTGDVIRPKFLNYISNDPDLTGLQVYLEDSEGNMFGEAVHYSLPGRNSPDHSGILKTIDNFNETFPDFLLPDNLRIGQYILVFNVLGGRDILYRSSQTMYYIADLSFSVDSIQTYMPTPYYGPQIPTGTTLLLEASITSDTGLDPYIIWYNGEKKIGEGLLSEQYHHLLWTVPETTGFHTIKAEVFPFVVNRYASTSAKGMAKELSLPVSAKAAASQSLNNNNGDALYWYQFAGSLESSKDSLRNDSVLVKTQTSPPRWEPLSDIYGLVIGEDDAYAIPDFSVSLQNESGTEYDLYTLHARFASKTTGTLFHASFKTAGSDLSSLLVEVLLEERELILSVQNGSRLYKKSIFHELFVNEEFLVAALHFYTFDNEFVTYLELQSPLSSTEMISVPYRGTLTGDGVFYFGTKQDSVNEPASGEGNLDVQSSGLAIMDEFLLEHSRKTVN